MSRNSNEIEYARLKRRYGNGYYSSRVYLKTKMIKRDGDVCQICKERFEFKKLSIDHIKQSPINERQDNKIENLRLLCIPCHQKKDGHAPRSKLYKIFIKQPKRLLLKTYYLIFRRIYKSCLKWMLKSLRSKWLT